MASTAIDKTYFHPFVKFFYIGDDRKKFSVMQNIVDRTNVYGLKKSEEAIATLDLALQYCVESKISMKDAIGLVDDGKKFIDVMQFLLDILSNKEIDDAIALKTVNNFKIILEKIQIINAALTVYIEIDKAQDEIKNGKTISHKQMLSYVQA